ncbi:efflux RND transporter periplasmic adaptor subunit [Vibrio sp. T187]|uniref:efflux RND transporter periplasmic adaptor subunit n=1 Tax=Vibrio TaxID=662 RepID=UPI0010C95A43|nr:MULTISPECIES: efflux RND transporter periplasmic adaptor subunit [Vibrio]MBW3696227.1 efflux RND transporter periplasmic adaptor subunit [Vibrio sp. T187]
MKFSHIALMLSSALVLQGCNNEVEHRELNPLTLSTFEVGAPLVSQIRKFNGQVMPAELTPLAFRIEGELSELLVENGDHVTKGQTLATLVDTKHAQELKDAQSQFDLSEKQLARGKELYGNKMVSQSELDELTANFKLAQVNLKRAKLNIKYTKLTAPFSGTVSEVSKKNFENITPGETVLSVYQDSQIYVRVNVSDSVLAMFNPDIKSERYKPMATFGGHSGEFELEYLEHTNELHPDSKTYEFWLKMPQIQPEVLPGTSVSVLVDMAKAGLSDVRGFQVPMTVLEAGNENGQFHVWKIIDGEAKQSPISVDKIAGQGALVSAGLDQGDILANSNLRKLRDGMEINGVAK